MMTELKEEEEQENQGQRRRRICDSCGDAVAILYCRADSAKLCLSCDAEVHSTNQLFTKHTRWLLCDACDSSPSSIFCCTHGSVLCQNCDWESHNVSPSAIHDRRPLEGFTGCPSVGELLGIFGFWDLKKKDLLLPGGDLDSGFEDFLVWDTPCVVTLDDLIVPSDSGNNLKAMGVPPLPKNRNASCGQHKEEILSQLSKMSMLEPNFNDEETRGDLKSIETVQNAWLEDMTAGFEQNTEPTSDGSFKINAFEWCSDIGEVPEDSFSSALLGGYIETNCVVPDKESDVGDSSIHPSGSHHGQKFDESTTAEALQVIPKVAVRELNSQERETALTRYKEKKKSRRYEKHIRYESRKLRAETRTRIKGRFAKMDRDVATQ